MTCSDCLPMALLWRLPLREECDPSSNDVT